MGYAFLIYEVILKNLFLVFPSLLGVLIKVFIKVLSRPESTQLRVALIDHEIILAFLKFVYNSIGFFTFLDVYLFWIEPEKILIPQLSLPKFRYFADQNGPKGETPWKSILIILKLKWGHLSSFHVSLLSYGL